MPGTVLSTRSIILKEIDVISFPVCLGSGHSGGFESCKGLDICMAFLCSLVCGGQLPSRSFVPPSSYHE